LKLCRGKSQQSRIDLRPIFTRQAPEGRIPFARVGDSRIEAPSQPA
jgi:hypothetical protein